MSLDVNQDANRDRVSSYVGRGAMIGAATVAWWIGLGLVGGWAMSRYDLTDPTLGNHMGTDAILFSYDLFMCVLFTLPAFVFPAWHAIRHRYLPILIGAVAVIWSFNTLIFLVGRDVCALGMESAYGLRGDGGIRLGLAAAAGISLAAGIMLGRRDDRGLGESLSVAAAIGATTSLIAFVQWSSCAGVSTQVSRDLIVYTFPLFAALAFPIVWIGGLVGRRQRSGPGPWG
jgi:hypothetical protein